MSSLVPRSCVLMDLSSWRCSLLTQKQAPYGVNAKTMQVLGEYQQPELLLPRLFCCRSSTTNLHALAICIFSRIALPSPAAACVLQCSARSGSLLLVPAQCALLTCSRHAKSSRVLACHSVDFCLTWLMACRERKNVNLPGVIVDLPTLTKKDEEDLVQWGLPNDIDFIAASFVRKGSDITNIRKVGLNTFCTGSVYPANAKSQQAALFVASCL